MQFAMAARFFGWSDAQMMSLSPRKFRAYFRQIGQISAGESLQRMRDALVARAEKSDIERVLRETERLARGESPITVVKGDQIKGFLDALNRKAGHK